MGLFDKKPTKGKDDFDSPVEEVNLQKPVPPSPRPPGTAPAGAPRLDAARPPGVVGSTSPAGGMAKQPSGPPPGGGPATARSAPPPEPELEIDVNFGINKAIDLWRKLPKDNVELVVTVIKTTLESLNIKVPSIVNDATRKQGEIEKRIDFLKKEIGDLEAEIGQRKKEIDGLQADHSETTEVKERLQLAEKLAADRKAAATK